MSRKNLPTTTQKPQTREELMPLMRPVSERLDPQREAQNAATISFELEVVSTKVDRFGWRDLSPEMKQRLTDDWTDTLREFPLAEVRRGIADCLDENPRRCPNEHDVKRKIMARRGAAIRSLPSKPVEAEQKPVQITEEERARRKAFAESVLKGVKPMSKENDT